MAIVIKSIPTLQKKEAKVFIRKADAKVSQRATVNFSMQVKDTYEILKKAHLR
jgi:hypothetical protein